MTTEQFNNYWNLSFPGIIPISHFFKTELSTRWFRIHSLPESKRYAESEEEWTLLLMRQNEIITDILGNKNKAFLVTGDYNWGEQSSHITDLEEIYRTYNFKRLANINLFELDPLEDDKDVIYRPAFAELLWTKNKFDILLKEIANDTLRAFFVSFDKNVIVAPYDGGIDFVLKDSATKGVFNEKYKKWLSSFPGGY